MSKILSVIEEKKRGKKSTYEAVQMRYVYLFQEEVNFIPSRSLLVGEIIRDTSKKYTTLSEMWLGKKSNVSFSAPSFPFQCCFL